MKPSLLRLSIVPILLVLGLVGAGVFTSSTRSVEAAPSAKPTNSHCSCLHNALEKKVVTAYGAWAYINWTNPNLNSGQWSYHRSGVTQSSPWRYVEFGWQKWTTNAARGLVVYNDGTGDHNVSVGSISLATHRYSMQYNSSTGKYDFFYDGYNTYSVNAGFSKGDYVFGGGEVPTGVEQMAHTRLYDLRYLTAASGGVFQLWNGHVNQVDDPPYYNANLDGNSFYDDP